MGKENCNWTNPFKFEGRANHRNVAARQYDEDEEEKSCLPDFDNCRNQNA
jgi:hypothetical protein